MCAVIGVILASADCQLDDQSVFVFCVKSTDKKHPSKHPDRLCLFPCVKSMLLITHVITFLLLLYFDVR